ncbi:MAG TPA: transposase DNA-binding-containing protein [Ktedonobacteraceae bacterium]|nr:transposase DNA-binding-containing protein [Ktedonobacteraceae bacterium]
MKTPEILNPQRWAETTFGQTHLKDLRRMRRAVTAATHMAEDPAARGPPRRKAGKMEKQCIDRSMNLMSPLLR